MGIFAPGEPIYWYEVLSTPVEPTYQYHVISIPVEPIYQYQVLSASVGYVHQYQVLPAAVEPMTQNPASRWNSIHYTPQNKNHTYYITLQTVPLS
jgi:hypothetical protein